MTGYMIFGIYVIKDKGILSLKNTLVELKYNVLRMRKQVGGWVRNLKCSPVKKTWARGIYSELEM